jgi:RluA family pseudouridine synthase
MPPPIRWIVRPGEQGTLAELVARAGGDARAIDDGRVFIGRRRARAKDERVREGDEISITPPHEARVTAVSILARDGDVVFVDKPAGIPTIPDQAGASHSLLVLVARAIGADASRVHPTSRLDRDVSGVVAFALSKAAADRLARAREKGDYARRYVAIASRAPTPDAGAWDTPIGRANDPRLRAPHGRNAVPARTLYATAARAGDAALLAVTPITGRTHQIRVHASHAGTALFGDRAYGGPDRVTLASGRVLAIKRIALHAARVSVPGPRGSRVVVSSPIPTELADLWRDLGGDASAWETAIEMS